MTTRAISSKALARDSSCIPMGCRSEAAGVAVNSKGHIYLFQRTKPMLTEYDDKGNFVQSIGEGLFVHPHGLRIDPDDNLWTTDDGNNLVLKLEPAGAVLLEVGRIDIG